MAQPAIPFSGTFAAALDVEEYGGGGTAVVGAKIGASGVAGSAGSAGQVHLHTA